MWVEVIERMNNNYFGNIYLKIVYFGGCVFDIAHIFGDNLILTMSIFVKLVEYALLWGKIPKSATLFELIPKIFWILCCWIFYSKKLFLYWVETDSWYLVNSYNNIQVKVLNLYLTLIDAFFSTFVVIWFFFEFQRLSSWSVNVSPKLCILKSKSHITVILFLVLSSLELLEYKLFFTEWHYIVKFKGWILISSG